MYNSPSWLEFSMSGIINCDQLVKCVPCWAIIMLGIVPIYIFLNTIPHYGQGPLVDNIAFAVDNGGKFNETDFIIKDFGIGTDGNPFLTVVGKAGGTIPQSEDLGYAYVFVTDNGIYSVASDWMYPKWHTHVITLDEKNCVGSIDMKGGAEVGDTVKVTNTNAKRVDKVMTAEFTINKVDGSICADKIFDSAR